MKYRAFGGTNWEISALGVGLFRMPQLAARRAGDAGPDPRRLVRLAIDRGVNFVDLGFPYLLDADDGALDDTADALACCHGKSVRLAVNLPAASARSVSDLDRFLDMQTERFAIERVDFCVLAGLDRNTWPRLRDMGALAWAERALAEGRFANIGFAFHDDAFFLREIAEACDFWSHCALQFSFMDTGHHPGVGGIKLASEYGLPVVVTDPLKGQGLTRNLPPAVSALWEGAPRGRPPAETGLRFAWDFPETVSVTLDAYSEAQLLEALALADGPASEPGNLTVYGQLAASRVRDAYRETRPVFCTACRCCKPCPKGIDFVRVFEIYNDAVMYGDAETARLLYGTEGHRIGDCADCALCLKTCPRKFGIPDILRDAERLLAVR
jgi:predicted aldo/keto reductase-like oxidoreductase